MAGDNQQPLLFNTLQVRNAIGQAGGAGPGSGANQRRKLSFRNVSNVVVQLLHSIKYSVEVPFSNMAPSAGGSLQQMANSHSSNSLPGHKKVPAFSLLDWSPRGGVLIVGCLADQGDGQVQDEDEEAARQFPPAPADEPGQQVPGAGH